MQTKIIAAAVSEAKKMKGKLKVLKEYAYLQLRNLSEKNKNLQDRKPETTERAQNTW